MRKSMFRNCDYQQFDQHLKQASQAWNIVPGSWNTSSTRPKLFFYFTHAIHDHIQCANSKALSFCIASAKTEKKASSHRMRRREGKRTCRREDKTTPLLQEEWKGRSVRILPCTSCITGHLLTLVVVVLYRFSKMAFLKKSTAQVWRHL